MALTKLKAGFIGWVWSPNRVFSLVLISTQCLFSFYFLKFCAMAIFFFLFPECFIPWPSVKGCSVNTVFMQPLSRQSGDFCHVFEAFLYPHPAVKTGYNIYFFSCAECVTSRVTRRAIIITGYNKPIIPSKITSDFANDPVGIISPKPSVVIVTKLK